MDTGFDLESLVHLEQSFYDEGYQDGHDHGRIHGLIEGRALGREKGFEMWEEMGFYAGFAKFWIALGSTQGQNGTAVNERSLHHAQHLLSLVAQFPTINPSQSSSSSSHAEIDISALQRQIRSRYKVLCASLGVRPSLRARSRLSGEDEEMAVESEEKTGEVTTNGGRTTGKKVWKVDASRGVGPQEPQGLSF